MFSVYLVHCQATSICCAVMTCGKNYCSTSFAKAALQMPNNSWHQGIVSLTGRGSSNRTSVVHRNSLTQPVNSSFAIHDNKLSSPWWLTRVGVLATTMEINVLDRATVRHLSLDETAQSRYRTFNSQHNKVYVSKPFWDLSVFCLYIIIFIHVSVVIWIHNIFGCLRVMSIMYNVCNVYSYNVNICIST